MAKVSKVQASHGPFSLLFCIGQFFSSAEQDNSQLQPFLSGLTLLPVPTFFIAADEQHHALIDGLSAGGELCPGLTYLGRAGVAKLGGLSVGYLSGVYDSERYFDVDEEQRRLRYDGHYVEDDVIKLSKEAAGEKLDLFLTTEWGRNWHSLLPEGALPDSLSGHPPQSVGSPVVSRLAAQLHVRYHFAAQHDRYFELKPYKNHDYFTRFFALGAHGSKSKEKSLYACNIAPAFTVDVTVQPADVTACPYTAHGKRDRQGRDDATAAANKRSKTPGFVRAGAMDDAMAEMPKGEELLMSQRWDFTPQQRRPPPPHYTCNLCHIPGHWIQNCPSRPPPSAAAADSDVPPASYLCKKCSKPGHYLRLCPLILEERTAAGSARVPGLPPPASYVCNKCHQPGHYIRDCPLIAEEMKGREDGGGQPPPLPADYRCRKCGGEHWIQRCPVIAEEERLRAKAREEAAAGEAGGGSGGVSESSCWFCLATAGVAVHLIVSVGDECYVALAKGPLVPQHLLILPIVHVQAATQLTDAQEKEMNNFKSALSSFYASQSLFPIVYERNIPTRAGQHLHVQVVPVTAEQLSAALPLLQAEAAALHIQLEQQPPDSSLKQLLGTDCPYISFELPGVRLYHRVVKGKVPGLFDFQRNVLAKLVGQPERGDWKLCKMSEAEETEAVDDIKERFGPFDFTQRPEDDSKG